MPTIDHLVLTVGGCREKGNAVYGEGVFEGTHFCLLDKNQLREGDAPYV